MWFIFFDILWLIIYDIRICFSFEWLFVMHLLVRSEFYIKNIYLFFFHNFIFHFNKKVDTINPFNKWVMLGLINLNPFNKHVGLVLTYIVEYSRVNTTQTWHANTNCHPYMQINSYRYIFLLNIDEHFVLSYNQ